MRLLIVTQAIDKHDPVLGFFHRWVEEIAKHAEHVHVICLKEGTHDLPENVLVNSLGKESGPSRFKYLKRFYSYIWRYRREYDSVFVHMNEEYVLLAGVPWFFWGKKVVLWRNHKQGSWRTKLAGFFTNTVCYTSPSAYVASFKNAVRMPIGIDTEFFSPGQHATDPKTVLFLGRIDPVKKADTFVRALEALHEKGIVFHADIVGDPSEPQSKYAHDVRNLAAPMALEGIVTVEKSVTNEQSRELYRTHAVYVNLTPSGSFDKTIGEAMSTGSLVVAANDAVEGTLPASLMPADESFESAAEAIRTALRMPESERRDVIARSREYIEREHSLKLLVEKLVPLLTTV